MFCTRIIRDLGFGHQTEEISQRLIKALLLQTEQNVQKLLEKLQCSSLRTQYTKLAKKIQSLRQEIKNSLIIRRLQVEKVTQELNQTKSQLFQRSNKVIQIQEQCRRQRQRAVNEQKRCEEFQRQIAEYQRKIISVQEWCEQLQMQVAEQKRKNTEIQEKCEEQQQKIQKRHLIGLQKLQKKIIRMQERIADLNSRTSRLSIFQPLLNNSLMAHANCLQEEYQSITISIKDSDPAEYIQYVQYVQYCIVIKKKSKSALMTQTYKDIKDEKKTKSHVI